VPSSAIGSVLESVLGSMLESILRDERWFGSVQSSRLAVCHRVQVGASLGACPGVYLRTYLEVYLGAYSECTWERLESLLGSV